MRESPAISNSPSHSPLIRVLFKPDSLNLNEPRRILWIEILHRIHRGFLLRVKVRRRAGATKDVSGALGAAQSDVAVHGLLAEDEGVFEKESLGGEVVSIVDYTED